MSKDGAQKRKNPVASGAVQRRVLEFLRSPSSQWTTTKRLVSTQEMRIIFQYYLLNAVLRSHSVLNSAGGFTRNHVGNSQSKLRRKKRIALTNQKIFNLDHKTYKKRDNLLI